MNCIPQDLHVHTIFSVGDGAVVPQMSIAFVAAMEHAEVRGISDHFEYLRGEIFDEYSAEVRKYGFYLGCEVNDSDDAREAIEYPYDYYIFHCRDRESEYRGTEVLLSTGKPVIISHPMAMGADLSRVPTDCYIEINNRYVWRDNYRAYFAPWIDTFRFVYGSDAHQPNWLNQVVARKIGSELGVMESVLFPVNAAVCS